VTLLQRLQQRFSSTRLFPQADGAIVLKPGGKATQWVIPREACVFLGIDVASIPPKRREGYAALALRRQLPFEPATIHVVVDGHWAMAWGWPQRGPQGDWPAEGEFLPESLLRGALRDEGAVIESMSVGVEARLWRENRLIACRWFPSRPGPEEWRSFLRGAGWASDAPAPDPAPAEWREQPWARSTMASFLPGRVGDLRRPLLAATALVAAAAIGWPLGQALRFQAALAGTEADIAALRDELGSVLDAKDAAQTDAAEAEALLGLEPAVNQLAALSAVDAGLGPTRLRLLEWDFQAGRGLRIVVAGATADPESTVQALMDAGLFDDVRIEPGNQEGQLVFNARIVRKDAPSP
jgi:hypothetical protein